MRCRCSYVGMFDVVSVLLSILLQLWCFAARPVEWRTTPGWYMNGVRPDGRFEARPVLGRPEDDLVDAVRQIVIDDDRRLEARIYCTGGATPHVAATRVWCQRDAR